MLRPITTALFVSIVGCMLLGSGCEGDAHGLRWGFRFVDPADFMRADFVEARILHGDCSSTDLLYAADLAVPSGTMMRPGELPAGAYCLVGRARDGECVWFAEGERVVQLPAEADQELIVDLRSSAESAACAPAACSAGRCGGGGDGGTDAGPLPDSGVDGGSDAGPTCESPLTSDGMGGCVDTMLDPDHCGAILNRCRDDQWCDAGTCDCRPGLTDDGAGACVDTETDPGNCGAIGTDCATMGTMVTCRAGTCQDACTTGQTNCSDACVDTRNDPLNCGTCGNVCARNRYCQDATCEVYEPGTGCSSCPCTVCGRSDCRIYGAAVICVND